MKKHKIKKGINYKINKQLVIDNQDSFWISQIEQSYIDTKTNKLVDETAMVINGLRGYYILRGKHIKKYAKLSKKEQIKYFLDNYKEYSHFFSTGDVDELKQYYKFLK